MLPKMRAVSSHRIGYPYVCMHMVPRDTSLLAGWLEGVGED